MQCSAVAPSQCNANPTPTVIASLLTGHEPTHNELGKQGTISFCLTAKLKRARLRQGNGGSECEWSWSNGTRRERHRDAGCGAMTSFLPEIPAWLRSEVDRICDQYGGVPRSRALPAWALSYLYELDEDEAFNKTETLIVGDGGVDGWYYDDNDKVFVLIQAKWSDEAEKKVYRAEDLDDLIRAHAALNGAPERLDSPDNKLLAIRGDLDTARQNGASVVLAWVTAGRVTDQAKDALTASALGIENCALEFYDLSRLSEIRASQQIISDLAGEQVEFEAREGTSISSVTMNVAGTDVRAAVVTLDGRKLGEAIHPRQPQIFHGNVRYSLGHRNKINKGMRETLASPESRSSFWLFNNGITVVCDSLVIEVEAGIVRATNPQIVNGAQTSTCLAETRTLIATGDVAVQARFIEIPPERLDSLQLVRDISQFTNSQSPVKEADLRSNEPRHLALQTAFGLLTPPVFYEKRRGEWEAITPAQRTQYGSPSRKVQKDQVGQRWRAYEGEPAQAITKKDEIFRDSTVEAKTFDSQRSAELYMLSYELFGGALALMQKQNAGLLEALVPGWFIGGIDSEHLSGFRKAPRYTAAYATALAHEVLKWRYTNIGAVRASRLRGKLAHGTEESDRLWRVVFKSLYTWSTTQQSENIKKVLQQDGTFSTVSPFLKNELAGEVKSAFLPNL